MPDRARFCLQYGQSAVIGAQGSEGMRHDEDEAPEKEASSWAGRRCTWLDDV